jgi:hypothetical protein
MKPYFSRDNLFVFLFFMVYFLTGITVAGDYGVHCDEFNSHEFGVRWYRYAADVVINGAPLKPEKIAIFHDIIHGPAIEMSFAFLAGKVFHLSDSREVIFLRHYGTWFLFYAGVVFFYLLCKLHFNSQKTALLGCLMLVLHPRIFANSFYNSVDIAFLSFYIISMYTLVRYLKTPSLIMAAIHALTCAILVDIRSIGLIIPFFTCILLFWDLADTRHDKKQLMAKTQNILMYSVGLGFFIILFWPYLWHNPLAGIIEIIKQTPRVAWGETVLYFGEYVKAKQLPWHYIPVWIGISTPLPYIFFFICGFFIIFTKCIHPTRSSKSGVKNVSLFICAFLLPLFLVIALNSTLYDSWRHMFFIYPAFVLIALTGIAGLFELIAKYRRGKTGFVLKGVLLSSILLSFLSTGIFMMQDHPYQNVYFNCLLGKKMEKAKDNFELDYWGLSYRKALEYIIENDKNNDIKVYDGMFWGPMIQNIKILPARDRQRIHQVGTPEEAKYLLTNYRWHKQDYPYANEYFSIRVGNAKIMSVFQLKK